MAFRRVGKGRLSPAALVVLAVIALFVAYPMAGVIALILGVIVAVAYAVSRISGMSQARTQLLGHALEDLDQLSGAEFEQWVTAVLDDAGIPAVNIRDQGDFGVDVVATVDGTRIGIQVKRYSSSVGNDAVQQALAGSGYHRCTLAAVVTQSTFTRAAREQASRARVPVLLVDRDGIPELAQRLREFAGAQ